MGTNKFKCRIFKGFIFCTEIGSTEIGDTDLIFILYFLKTVYNSRVWCGDQLGLITCDWLNIKKPNQFHNGLRNWLFVVCCSVGNFPLSDFKHATYYAYFFLT